MLEEMVVKNCSPTLAGIKTGCIFSCRFESGKAMTDSLSSLNILFREHGLRAIPLKHTGCGHSIVYIYRPEMLKKDIAAGRAREILQNFGYDTGNVSACIARLMKRIRDSRLGSFPHEIGLFLGYPPEDVDGFIQHKAKDYKLCGMWKVYGDVEDAKTKFLSYRACTENCYRCWRSEGSIKNILSDRNYHQKEESSHE